MGLSELLATMEREAGARAESIRQAAREEATRLVGEAGKRTASRQAVTVDGERVRMREASNHRVVEERRRARSELLQLRQDLLTRIRELARKELAGMSEESRYRAILPGLVQSSLQGLSGNGARVRAASRLATTLAAINDGHVKVEEDAGILAGFIVESGDGRRQVDHRLEQRLDALWPRLAIVLCREIGTSL